MLKILHFVPSAFEYFDNIRKEAFTLIDSLGELGFENYVFTLQYSTVSKRLEKEIKEKTKDKMGFEKIHTMEEVEDKINEADIVHLHAPFLGMGKKLLEYKKKYPQKKFIVTVYRNLPYVDFFTIIIWLYNSWYLKRILNICDFVCASDEQVFKEARGFSMLKDEKKFVSIINLINFINDNNPSLAEKFGEVKIKTPQFQNALAYGELYRLLNGE